MGWLGRLLGWDFDERPIKMFIPHPGRPVVHMMLMRGNALMPKRATIGSAGYDLFACLGPVQVPLEPGMRTSIPCGVAIAMPNGVEAQCRGRSGLFDKHGITVHVGTVDSDYRGELKVLMANTSKRKYTIKHGDRIGQLVFNRVEAPEFKLVDALGTTRRGTKGFGSTGR